MRLLLSSARDPFIHQAMEAHLLRSRRKEPVLLLYRNAPSVLCGRSQSLAAECDLAFCREHGIALVRRLSGGGTVFQDEGNLNYALVLPSREFAPDAILRRIQEALCSLGLPCTADEHRSLFVHGRKVSGAASAVNRVNALWHGCILVHTDLRMLKRALDSPCPDDEPSSVRSRRVPVANLADFLPALTLQEVSDAIVRRFPECRPARNLPSSTLDTSRFSSPEWLFNRDGRPC